MAVSALRIGQQETTTLPVTGESIATITKAAEPMETAHGLMMMRAKVLAGTLRAALILDGDQGLWAPFTLR